MLIFGVICMADRRQFSTIPEVSPELLDLLSKAKTAPVSDEDLREQRISFAFGNALNANLITKESVRRSSEHIRLTTL